MDSKSDTTSKISTRRRRRRRERSKGQYFSTKMKKFFAYRSLWEKSVMEYLDLNDDIISYDYECYKIQYKYKPRKRQIIKNYIPDFLVETKKSKKKILVEVKPQSRMNTIKNQSKFYAAKEFCKNKNLKFEVWEDEKIKEIRKFLSDHEEKEFLESFTNDQVKEIRKERKNGALLRDLSQKYKIKKISTLKKIL